MKKPKAHVQAPKLEDPATKLQRISDEWQGIWGGVNKLEVPRDASPQGGLVVVLISPPNLTLLPSLTALPWQFRREVQRPPA